MLPTELKEALKAMKDQAKAAGMQLETGATDLSRESLVDAQKRMAQYEPETKMIHRFLLATMDESLTIETLDEERLAKEFGFA